MVYVFLAEGFEEIEALSVVDILRRAEIEVKTVSVNEGREVTGSHGITVLADITNPEAKCGIAEAVVLPGGIPGTPNLQKDDKVKEIVMDCYENGKYVCAICAAPSVLGYYGILKGKKATCYPGFEEKLTGAEAVEDAVCICDNVITSRGAGTAAQFAFAIAGILKNPETAETLRRGMIYA